MTELPAFHWDPRNAQPRRLSSGLVLLELDGVAGFMIPGDVGTLFDIGRSLPPGGAYLEVGSWMGLSVTIAVAAALGCGNSSARFFCVDTWLGSVEHSDIDLIREGRLYDIFLNGLRRTGAYHWVTPLRGESREMAHYIANGSMDVIFIDGDHTYGGCAADLEAWYPKLKPSGRFIGHDATEIVNEGCGVRPAVADFCAARGLHYRITPPPAANFLWEIVAAPFDSR